MSATYIDPTGVTRCADCCAPTVVRDGLVRLAHLTWCPRVPRTPRPPALVERLRPEFGDQAEDQALTYEACARCGFSTEPGHTLCADCQHPARGGAR